MRHFRLIALLFGMLVGVVPARAVLMEGDWLTPGDRHLTVDTQTHLAWLDVTVTAGRTAGQVLALLQSDSRYSGFRYATPQEFLQLAQNAGIPRLDGFVVVENLAPTLALQDLVGSTVDLASLQLTTGMVDDASFGPNFWPHAVLLSRTDALVDSVGAAVLYPNGGFAVDVSNPTVGSWLVARVPAPGTLALTALACIGLAICRRRIEVPSRSH